jgi:hypothetical protein
MIEQAAHTQRVTCSQPGPRNARGQPKPLATIEPDGIWVYCGHCKEPHFLARSVVMAAWGRGGSVQCGWQDEAGVE